MTIQKVDLLRQVGGYFIAEQATIEALTGIAEGALGYATDTNKFGSYDGSSWTWGSGDFDLPGAIHAASSATFADADEIGFWQSVGGLLKKMTWANIISLLGSTLTDYFAINGHTHSYATTSDILAATAGALQILGSTDCSGNPNYPGSSHAGDCYIVSVAGKVGGASGKVVNVGDLYYCDADNAGGTEASVGTHWFILAEGRRGVTNGDSHDHNGGDGAQISFANLSNAFSDAEGDPAALGTAADGSSAYAARRDHAHPTTGVVLTTAMPGHMWLNWGIYTNFNPLTADLQQPYSATLDRTVTFISFHQEAYVVAPNDSSNYWKIQINRASDGAVIGEVKTNTSSAGALIHLSTTSFSIASAGVSDHSVYMYVRKIGSPGNLYIFGPSVEVSI